MYNQDYITLGFTYDIPFARTNFSVSKNRGKIITSESAQGSMAFGGDKYTHVSNNSSVEQRRHFIVPIP